MHCDYKQIHLRDEELKGPVKELYQICNKALKRNGVISAGRLVGQYYERKNIHVFYNKKHNH